MFNASVSYDCLDGNGAFACCSHLPSLLVFGSSLTPIEAAG